MDGEKQPDGPKRIIPVRKEVLEDGILQLLASAAEMQQRKDLDAALSLYEAAMDKVKSHGLNRKRLFAGTNQKPPPLNSRTPLEWCLHVGDMPSAICLLGGPNLALAKLGSSKRLDHIEKILDAGASVEQRFGSLGRTLLLQEASEGSLNGVNLALDRGANIHCMDDSGDTALAIALRSSKPQAKPIVAALLQSDADVETIDGQGNSLLKVALTHGQVENVAQVIGHFAALNEEHREDMRTWATSLPANSDQWSDRTCSVLRLLLEHGLDPRLTFQPKAPLSLFEAAVRRQLPNSEQLVAGLLKTGVQPNLEAALHGRNPNIIALVLEEISPLTDAQQPQIMAWLKTLQEPRHWSKVVGRILELLLEFGLDPNLRLPAAPHSPLVICAASYGNVGFLRRLIKLGANLTVSDDNSDTALIVAAKRQDRQIYDTLKAAGVNDSYFIFGTVWGNYARHR